MNTETIVMIILGIAVGILGITLCYLFSRPNIPTWYIPWWLWNKGNDPKADVTPPSDVIWFTRIQGLLGGVFMIVWGVLVTGKGLTAL